MNKTRRNKLRELLTEIEKLREIIESVRDEEDEARESMPESLCDSDRYISSEDSSEAMGSALDALDEAIGYIEEATQG